jgi:C1A family cysteine protease
MDEKPIGLRMEFSQPLRSPLKRSTISGSPDTAMGGGYMGSGGYMGGGYQGNSNYQIIGSYGDRSMNLRSLGQSASLRVGLGYHCDTPDHRDCNLKVIQKVLSKTHKDALAKSFFFMKKTPSKRCDIRKKHSWSVDNQGPIHSCTAHAVIGMIEFLMYQSRGISEELSRLFLYKTTRRLLGSQGDSGATLRATLKAVARFGVPQEQYWPYNISKYDMDPDAFVYSICQPYKPLNYTRLDDYGLSGTETLESVKRVLCDGIPVAFGFPVYSSLNSNKPDIPIPGLGDRLIGGHAVVAVGYDDNHRVSGQDGGGAIVFRNSWGPLWGKDGYGYLPYDFIRKQWAVDFWAIFHPLWLNSKDFQSSVDA